MRRLHLVRFVVPCLVLNLFLMRPGALGQSFQGISLVVAVVLCALHFLLLNRASFKTAHGGKEEMGRYLVLFILFWLYEIPVGLAGRSNIEFLIKEFVSSIVVFLCYGLILIQVEENKRFFRFLCTIIALIGASCGLTIVLGSLIGFEKLFITHIRVAGYEAVMLDDNMRTGSLYFPFSMLYAKYTSGDVELMRFNGFFREAGIYQAVCCFCIAYEYYTRRSKLVMLGAAIGAFAAFSSLGVLLLLMTVGAIFVMRIKGVFVKFFFVFALSLVVFPAFLYAPYIGLAAKQDTHGTSVTDRTEAMSNGLNALGDYPLGSGLFSGLEANAGITLVAAIGQIGIFGFLLQVLMLSGWRWKINRSALLKMLICAPLLITALISQPIAGSTIMYVLPMVFLVSYSEKNRFRQQV
ncbi:hypothetical protein [Pseudomonas psychrophila]|uniref:hypothetical protein n=1 Tax=Pseudomonas psychrophila TaxID=122355 RepID=UPI0002F69C41|nr:hypothetical protein [Pseudomonas psychrophila]